MSKKKKKNSSRKTVWYRQCTYTSPTEKGEAAETAWIPEHLAVVGKKIYFGKKTSKPSELWTVASVGGRKSGDYLGAHERDFLSQREASDV